jgi:hypothetical protein
MDSYVESFLAKHAISEEIGGRGRYVHFEQGDTDLVTSYFESFGDTKLERFGRTVAGQEEGLIINRVGYGMNIPPQLRPDHPVFRLQAPRLSFHPDDLSVKGRYYTTSKGKRVWVPALPVGPRERHIAKKHPDGNVQGVHLHHPSAKYAIPPGAHGKRLDVPLPDRIVRADRVFFVIEGSVKTDAILSTGEAAFGVPSVTLWDAPELNAFIAAMHLRDRQVVIVPDADWANNPDVITQAMLLRTYLRDRHVEAVVAAPPLEDGQVTLKGVDDFLADGRSLEELSVLEREPAANLGAWGALYLNRWDGYRQTSQTSNGMTALAKLSLHADRNGQLYKNLAAVARILGRGRNRVRSTLEDLERAEMIEVEGGLEAGFQYEDKQTGSRHNYDWDDRPLITIAGRYRAVERFIPLSDLPILKSTQKVEADIVRA